MHDLAKAVPLQAKAVDLLARKAPRLFAPDALRGLIMLAMALDHANHFVAHKHPPSEAWGGAFPVYYDPVAFWTRFVTHFCAPGFFLLMGMGMALLAHARWEQGWSRWAVVRHFLVRGAVIIALKLLLVNRAWEFSPGGWGIQIHIGVLFALGGTMILGSALLLLKQPVLLLAVSLLLAIGMEFLSPDPSTWGPSTNAAKLILLEPGGLISPQGSALIWSNYPVLPWLELVVLGMGFGFWLARDQRKAFGWAWKLGLALLAAFVVVRVLDGFGNIRPRMGNDLSDWLTTVKYPPSLAFTLITTGVNLIALWAFSRAGALTQRILHPLVVLGRAPLVFYVLHLFLYAGLGALLTPRGVTIPLMYPIWLLGVLILFPVCWWYGRLKRRQSLRWVLSYL
ncbi:MAG: DUF1624 domain-containing protein [Anaerolineae bacterium]|nr:DUF1624 domain-containing protein [Anaerolineae bacterium]